MPERHCVGCSDSLAGTANSRADQVKRIVQEITLHEKDEEYLEVLSRSSGGISFPSNPNTDASKWGNQARFGLNRKCQSRLTKVICATLPLENVAWS